jgi:hypothetical protein
MVEPPPPTSSKIDCIEKGKMGNRKMFHLAEIEVTFQPANGKLREDIIVCCVVWRIFGHYNNRQRECTFSPFPEGKKPTTMV